MAKTLQAKAALCDYRPVRFSHFDVEPGFRYMLSADPWGYLRVYLTEEAASHRPKDRWLNALAFLDLAEGFYTAANRSQHPTKAVLVYYSLLNLMKVVISAVGGVKLGDSPEHHGLTYPGGDTLSVMCSSDSGQRNIFYEFAKCLGTEITTSSLSIQDTILNIPEIHELSVALLNETGSRCFVPVRIDFLVDDREDGEKPRHIWTQMSYEKKEEGQVKKLREKMLRGSRKEYFKPPTEENGQVIFESKRKKALTYKKGNWSRVYRNICGEFSSFSLFSLLSRQGYKYYVNLSNPALPQLCYPVLFCFYLGTICRYRPVTLESVMASRIGPAVTECLSICPRQFLYQIAGLVTKQVVVVPQASI